MNDAVTALEKLIYLNKFFIINIAHPHVIEMEQLARRFCEIYGRSYEEYVKEIPLPSQMTLEKIPDVSRQKYLLGFEPRIDIEEGIKRVADRIMEEFKGVVPPLPKLEGDISLHRAVFH
jgi:nucleoside-diphosphate-sugar epimerase